MIVTILEEAGYRVSQAVNAREGASLIDRVDPNLVITDIFMPEGDGFEMLRAIRHRDRPVPVIVMSGTAKTATVNFLDLADRLGAAHVLAKPFKRQQLLDAVERALAAAAG
jgi:DNA-binding NtrC family response regulator